MYQVPRCGLGSALDRGGNVQENDLAHTLGWRENGFKPSDRRLVDDHGHVAAVSGVYLVDSVPLSFRKGGPLVEIEN